MQFLYPAFLFALVTLAIPVIIHLFNFRRYQKVYFSNVQFLKEVQEQQASRRNLKERLATIYKDSFRFKYGQDAEGTWITTVEIPFSKHAPG